MGVGRREGKRGGNKSPESLIATHVLRGLKRHAIRLQLMNGAVLFLRNFMKGYRRKEDGVLSKIIFDLPAYC